MLIDYGLVMGYYAQVKSAYFSDDAQVFVFDCLEPLPSYRLQVGEHGTNVTIRIPGEMLNFGSLATVVDPDECASREFF